MEKEVVEEPSLDLNSRPTQHDIGLDPPLEDPMTNTQE
jgi:hypothetical protein